MKFRKVLAILVGAVMCTALLCGCTEGDNSDCSVGAVNMAAIKGKAVELKSGDKLHADVWNKEGYYSLNGDKLKNQPGLYKGVTIGSDLKYVIDTFGIKPGYAIINREVSTPEQDGTTDIVEEVYKDTSFWDKESVLEAEFSWGYKKVDGKWKMVTAKELKKGKADLVYGVDFVGDLMASDVSVDEQQVVSFNVEMK